MADSGYHTRSKVTKFDIVIIGMCNSVSAWFAPYTSGEDDDTFESNGLLHGGKGASQALLASRLGASVAFVSKACNDKVTQLCLKTLKQFGVNVSHVVPCKNCKNNDSMVDSQPNNAFGCSSYLNELHILAVESLLCRAEVVIVHLAIGVEATFRALTLCKDKMSILYASPLPNIHTEFLLKMATFVILDGRRDLDVDLNYGCWNNIVRKPKMKKSNTINRLMAYLLHIGLNNVIILWNGFFEVIAGNGLKMYAETASGPCNVIKWRDIYNSSIPFSDLEHSEGNECVASLAIVLAHCSKHNKFFSLEQIINYCHTILNICYKNDSFVKSKCISRLISRLLNRDPRYEQKYFDVLL